MLRGHVRVVQGHSEESSVRKNILGLGPFDHRLEGGKHPIHFESIRNPNIGGLPFGKVDQSDWERRALFVRAHGKIISFIREEVFANLALLDLAALSKLARRSVVAGAEGARKSG